MNVTLFCIKGRGIVAEIDGASDVDFKIGQKVTLTVEVRGVESATSGVSHRQVALVLGAKATLDVAGGEDGALREAVRVVVDRWERAIRDRNISAIYDPEIRALKAALVQPPAPTEAPARRPLIGEPIGVCHAGGAEGCADAEWYGGEWGVPKCHHPEHWRRP